MKTYRYTVISLNRNFTKLERADINEVLAENPNIDIFLGKNYILVSSPSDSRDLAILLAKDGRTKRIFERYKYDWDA